MIGDFVDRCIDRNPAVLCTLEEGHRSTCFAHLANIAFKLVQRMGEAGAYGPFLQGFAKTASDLSRGCTVEDIVGVSVMAVLEAQGRRR